MVGKRQIFFWPRVWICPLSPVMQKKYLLLSCFGAVLFCGCNQQARINNEKIQTLSQKIAELEQAQSKQMAVIQSELTSLAPTMNKMNNTYFEKNRDDALFFHTNTLYLLLTVGKQISAQLGVADTERIAQNSLAYSYHTNELTTLYLCTAQIEDAMNSQLSQIQASLTAQEKRIEDNINASTTQANTTLSDALLKQIKLSATPSAEETARQAKMAADLAQLQRDLAAIKTKLDALTAPPAVASPLVHP
jgi:hypothetical protein